MQFVYESPVYGNKTFGPAFSKDFLVEVLRLQKKIESIVGSENTTLGDICVKPLEPYNNQCATMSALGWWQGNEELLDVTNNKTIGDVDVVVNYLDHVLFCVK